MEVPPRATVTTGIAAVTLAALAVAAAGCGFSVKTTAPADTSRSAAAGTTAGTEPTSTAPGPVTSSTPSGAAANGGQSAGRCHTSMLSAHVVMGQPGAGQRYADLVLTNNSSTTCRVYGYPGMQLVSSSGGHVPTAVERAPGSEPLVTLAPGQQASTLLHWTVVPGTGEGSPCEPTASGLVVTPPDETAPLQTSWPGGTVCQHGQIYVTAFEAGANAH